MRWIKFLYGVVVAGSLWGASQVSLPPLAKAAQYYFSQNDYSESLNLWSQVYALQPRSEEAMLKVAELQLMLQGHDAAQRTVLDFIQSNRHRLSPSSLEEVMKKLSYFQNRFVKDEAQSLYFQSIAKIKLKDYSQALVLLNQALSLEKGNLLLLESKAQCEKLLGFLGKYYDTLKVASEVANLSAHWTENLLESRYYFKDFSEVLSWYETQVKPNLTYRQKLAVAMALIEKGEDKEAAYLLERLSQVGLQKSVHPLVWYGYGRIFLQSPTMKGVAAQYLERFVSAMKSPHSVLIEGWDPYHCDEKLTQAQSWLSKS